MTDPLATLADLQKRLEQARTDAAATFDADAKLQIATIADAVRTLADLAEKRETLLGHDARWLKRLGAPYLVRNAVSTLLRPDPAPTAEKTAETTAKRRARRTPPVAVPNPDAPPLEA